MTLKEMNAPNQITILAAVHSAKRKGKPFQLSPVWSMIAWITFGPIIDDARFDSPNSPKNCVHTTQLSDKEEGEERVERGRGEGRNNSFLGSTCHEKSNVGWNCREFIF